MNRLHCLRGQADADVIRATGTSEAEIIALQGTAEAEAMAKKAASFQQYNQAAVLQLMIEALPAIARAITEPLSKIDSITMVSTGGEGTGVSKLTSDIAKVMAELPAIVEGLSGVDLRNLAKELPAIQRALKERPAEEEEEEGEAEATEGEGETAT